MRLNARLPTAITTIFFYTTSLCVLLTGQSSYAKDSIHAMVACDTLSDLGFSTAPDCQRLEKALKLVAKHARLGLELEKLSGQRFSHAHVQKWLSSLKGKKPKVVFLYFSSHGFRTEKMSSLWPAILFSRTRVAVKASGLCQAAQALNSQLVIAIFDCCNSEPPKKGGLEVPIPLQPSLRAPIRSKVLGAGRGARAKNHATRASFPGFATLFRYAHGSVFAVGCSPGEEAYAFGSGGFFTSAFLQALKICGKANDPSWEEVARRTQTLCGEVQRPLFLTSVEPEARPLDLKREQAGAAHRRP